MLLYVDKKKEKQKRIKRICIILFCIFFIAINIYQFNRSLQYTNQSLTTYKSLQHLSPWFKEANIVHLLTNKTKNNYSVILLPINLNRENTITTAFALSKLPQKNYKVLIAKDIIEKELLQKLLSLLQPNAILTDSIATANILITKNYETASSFISNKKLYPTALNYKHAQKILDYPDIASFFNQVFPKKPEPKSKIEEEANKLQLFITDYQTELKNFIFHKKDIEFPTQNLFLQNIRLCLKTKDNDPSCSLSNELSLKENFYRAQANLSQESQIGKLYLLTSDSPISAQETTKLEADEGVHFVYQNLEKILLPEDINQLDNISETFYILKEKAGINPMFNAPDMYFYKFKVKEITKDEEI